MNEFAQLLFNAPILFYIDSKMEEKSYSVVVSRK